MPTRLGGPGDRALQLHPGHRRDELDAASDELPEPRERERHLEEVRAERHDDGEGRPSGRQRRDEPAEEPRRGLLVDAHEQLLELVDHEEDPASLRIPGLADERRDVAGLVRASRGRGRHGTAARREGGGELPERRDTGQHRRDLPRAAFGERARAQGRDEAGAHDAGLAAAARPDHREQAAVVDDGLEPVEEAPEEVLTTEEVGAVGLAERAQPLVRVARAPDRTARRWRREHGVLREDPRLELRDLRRRVDAELLGEEAPPGSGDAERLGLPTGTVEGEHEQGANPLAQRVRLEQRLEVGNRGGVRAEGDLGVETVLERTQPELVEAADLRLGELGVGHVKQRVAAPQAEGLGQLGTGGGRIVHEPGVAFTRQALEPGGVDGLRIHAQDVAARLRHEAACGRAGPPFGRQRIAQPRDVERERLRTARRQVGAPDGLGDDVRRQHPVRVDDQQGQQGPLSARRHGQDPAVVDDLEWAQDPELHLRASRRR